MSSSKNNDARGWRPYTPLYLQQDHDYECEAASDGWAAGPKMVWQEVMGSNDVEKHARPSPRPRRHLTRSIPRLIRLTSAMAVGFFIGMFVNTYSKCEDRVHFADNKQPNRIMFRMTTSFFYEQPDPFDEVFSHNRHGSHERHGRHGSPHSLQDSSDRKLEDTEFAKHREALMHNVIPVRCHSHNDYWRSTPLFAALGSGCISVEADVWLYDENLYVGHDTGSLTREATLSGLYLDPLEKMLRSINSDTDIGKSTTNGSHGVFTVDPSQNLVLLIDFKTAGAETFASVSTALSRLRNANWLTYWNGTYRIERPLTIVATGNAPFDLLTANTTYRDIFYDAPLNRLDDPSDAAPPESSSRPDGEVNTDDNHLGYKYNPSNSYYASTDFKGIVGYLNTFRITTSQVNALTGYMHQAELRGLVPRVWGTPRWPRNFRDHVWQILLEGGVGVLNVDDLRAARKGNWGQWV